MHDCTPFKLCPFKLLIMFEIDFILIILYKTRRWLNLSWPQDNPSSHLNVIIWFYLKDAPDKHLSFTFGRLGVKLLIQFSSQNNRKTSFHCKKILYYYFQFKVLMLDAKIKIFRMGVFVWNPSFLVSKTSLYNSRIVQNVKMSWSKSELIRR